MTGLESDLFVYVSRIRYRNYCKISLENSGNIWVSRRMRMKWEQASSMVVGRLYYLLLSLHWTLMWTAKLDNFIFRRAEIALWN